jgi:hypothetical protein
MPIQHVADSAGENVLLQTPTPLLDRSARPGLAEARDAVPHIVPQIERRLVLGSIQEQVSHILRNLPG